MAAFETAQCQFEARVRGEEWACTIYAYVVQEGGQSGGWVVIHIKQTVCAQ